MRLASFVVFAFLTACAARPATVPPPGLPERVLTARVVVMNNTMPRLTGTITMKSSDDETYSVSFDLRGARANSQLEWAVRPGRCGVGIPVPDSDVAGRDAYRPIRIQSDGEVHDNVKLRALLPDEALHVDLMTDAGRRENVIACGMLVER